MVVAIILYMKYKFNSDISCMFFCMFTETCFTKVAILEAVLVMAEEEEDMVVEDLDMATRVGAMEVAMTTTEEVMLKGIRTLGLSFSPLYCGRNSKVFVVAEYVFLLKNYLGCCGG